MVGHDRTERLMIPRPLLRLGVVAALALAVAAPGATPAAAKPLVTPFQAAVAARVGEDEALAAFYRARGFAPIWMGEGAEARRAALLGALADAPVHGLPTHGLDAGRLRAAFAAARGPSGRGAVEVETTRHLLRLARDMATGALDPRRVSPTLVLEKPAFDAVGFLSRFAAAADPDGALRDLRPRTGRYNRLLATKMRLEAQRAAGGWGAPVPPGKLAPGASGPAVVALRDRLVRMGYLRRTAAATYDAALAEAVRLFQADHGLAADGIAGGATIAAVNATLEEKLDRVLVGLERQRWTNRTLEPRHILVNLAEQRAYVVDDGVVTFDTVAVVGHPDADRQTPEFSDTMTHMVINPTWNVPRSIATGEYLPALKRGGARHLRLYRNGREVSRSGINFSRYTARTFPFDLKQPPGPRNALGRVKFMFPNRWNIYLHDTPAKGLFGRDVRLFSHGCVRIGRPFELAHHLLAPQEAEPAATFNRILRTERERRVDLETPVGVHIVSWSVWTSPDGRTHWRDDPYGRDAAILAALRRLGVETAPPRG